ncbi:hypothetical protein PpBr36_02855 [Pyricularia pennisetigena]|uniref:hypothetical protein n=1 Tax=Pyricularia pennisetigena TaxID=1578925 RepID=UPI00114F932C|nr:hypothetical protein PpBr36_02855 [Pyricularia pennisetigena]TLS30823.1 hypothetical protein PpBr36_02855 [Pyricularia pennisetigena]
MLSGSLPHISPHRRQVSPSIFNGSQTENLGSQVRKPSKADGVDENVEPRPGALRRVSASNLQPAPLAAEPDSNDEIASCQQPPSHLTKDKKISLKLRNHPRAPPTSTQLRQVQPGFNGQEEGLPNPSQWSTARNVSRSSNGSPRPYRFLLDNPFPSLESLTLSGGNVENLLNSEVPWTVGRSFRHGSLELDYTSQDATCTAVRSTSSSYPTEGQRSSEDAASPPRGSIRDRWFVSLGRFSKPYGRLSLLFRTSSSSGYGQKAHETSDEDNQSEQDTATTVDSSDDVFTISAEEPKDNATLRINEPTTADNGISGHHVPEVQEINSPTLSVYRPFPKVEPPIRSMEVVTPRKLQRSSIHGSLFEGLEKVNLGATALSTEPLFEGSPQTADSAAAVQNTDEKLVMVNPSEVSLKCEARSRSDSRRLRGGGGLKKLKLKLENSRLGRYYRHTMRRRTSHDLDISEGQKRRCTMRKEKIHWYQPWRRVKWFKDAQYRKEPRATNGTPRPQSSGDGASECSIMNSNEKSKGGQTNPQRQGSRFRTEFDANGGLLINQEPNQGALHRANLRAGMGVHLEQIVEVSSEFERSIQEEAVGTTTAEATPPEQQPSHPLARSSEIVNTGNTRVDEPPLSKVSDEQAGSEAEILLVPGLVSADTLVSGVQGAATPIRSASRAATVTSTGIDSLTNENNFDDDAGYLLSTDSINSATFPFSEPICRHNNVVAGSSLTV